MTKRNSIPGVSFSVKRALGITKGEADQSEDGDPMTYFLNKVYLLLLMQYIFFDKLDKSQDVIFFFATQRNLSKLYDIYVNANCRKLNVTFKLMRNQRKYEMSCCLHNEWCFADFPYFLILQPPLNYNCPINNNSSNSPFLIIYIESTF